MKLSRIDLIPLLTIMAGGVLGASLSFGFLGLLSSGDVPAPDAVVVLSVTPELAVRVESSGGAVVTAASIEFDGIVITPVVAPSAPAEEPTSSVQASGFDLQQNYPNPFNPATTIPFILHEGLFAEGRSAQVSMRIFNVLMEAVASPVALGHSSGEEVELIELEYTQPGTYEAF